MFWARAGLLATIDAAPIRMVNRCFFIGLHSRYQLPAASATSLKVKHLLFHLMLEGTAQRMPIIGRLPARNNQLKPDESKG